MSIHYLLDGYNITHQMPALNRSNLEDQRWQLIRFIELCAPQGSVRNKVTVVFDGSIEAFGGMISAAAKIVFTQGESADENIKKIVSTAANTKSMIVVSDDRDVQYAVRALGAKTLSVREFIGKGKKGIPKTAGHKRKSPSKESSSGLKKHVSKTDESKINSELGKIWLGPEGKH